MGAKLQTMLKNYFKIAWRNLVKTKGYSFINIGGLAVGMAVAMLIGLWIYDELNYDKYHKNYESIGQLWGGGTDPETSAIDGSISMQYPMAAVLRNNYSQYFKQVLMGWWFGAYSISNGNNRFTKTGEYIEAGAPEMLSLKMLKGTYACLNDPNSIVLSRSTAEAIFGSEDPMYKALKIDNRIDVKVTGVYEDIPKNNRFGEIQFFSPWSLWVASNSWIKQNENNWDNRTFNIYVQLQPGISFETANAAINNFYYKNVPGDFLKQISKYKPFAQVVPMRTWHLYSEFKDGQPAAGRITFVWLFAIVGFFVLLLACINFINLSTARSEKRAKEVGIRKAIGSLKWQLVKQFLSESFLVVLLAFILSFVLVLLLLSWFNGLADKEMVLPLSSPVFWIIITIFVTVTAFIAGLYPAFYLASFQPVKVLKGTMRLGRFASIPRKILVVVQFTVSVILIIGTIIVYQQIQHARNRPVGYNRDGVVFVPMADPAYKDKQEVLKAELLNTGMISDMATSSSPFTDVYNNEGGFTWTGKDPAAESDFAITRVSYDFGKLAGWQFIAGRDFSRSFATDSSSIIINETAAKYIGLKNPVGEFIKSEDGKDTWQIAGVIKDMLMQSPYEPVKAGFFFLDQHYTDARFINIKIKPTVSASEALPKIEAVFKLLVPSAPFDYKFVDQEYAKKFGQEQRIGKLSTFFAILAIFISCLGLFGLAAFTAEQRTKEIGVRKVLGATIANIWTLLSTEFILLVIISFLIATPIAWYVMHTWLLQYKYKIDIPLWVFIVTGLMALLITIATVSFQAIKAAIANPVKSLKAD